MILKHLWHVYLVFACACVSKYVSPFCLPVGLPVCPSLYVRIHAWMHGCMDAWMHGCMYVYVYVSLSFCLHFHGPVNRIVEKHDFCYRVLWERACSMAGFAGKCCWQVCMCTPAFACLSTRYLILQHAHNSRTDLAGFLARAASAGLSA